MALKHGHYVPRFYLRGFTLGGGDNDTLFVFDRQSATQWRSTPYKAAKERGMYAVDGPKAEIMEETLSKAEDIFARIIARIVETNEFPVGNDWIEFLGFVAVTFTRSRQQRDRFQKIGEALSSEDLLAVIDGADGPAKLQNALLQCGLPPNGLSVEMIRSVIDAEGAGFFSKKEIYLYALANNAAALVPVLSEREWTIWTCSKEAPDLVCSDHPISITKMEGAEETVGIGSRQTVLSLPINRRMVAIGTYAGKYSRTELDETGVAKINTATMVYADQIYSASKSFMWLGTMV